MPPACIFLHESSSIGPSHGIKTLCFSPNLLFLILFVCLFNCHSVENFETATVPALLGKKQAEAEVLGFPLEQKSHVLVGEVSASMQKGGTGQGPAMASLVPSSKAVFGALGISCPRPSGNSCLTLQGSQVAGSRQITCRMRPVSRLFLQDSERSPLPQMKRFSHLPFACPPATSVCPSSKYSTFLFFLRLFWVPRFLYFLSRSLCPFPAPRLLLWALGGLK